MLWMVLPCNDSVSCLLRKKREIHSCWTSSELPQMVLQLADRRLLCYWNTVCSDVFYITHDQFGSSDRCACAVATLAVIIVPNDIKASMIWQEERMIPTTDDCGDVFIRCKININTTPFSQYRTWIIISQISFSIVTTYNKLCLGWYKCSITSSC